VAAATCGLSFRAKLVLGVCGLVLLTGAIVLWLAHRSARATTEALTGSVFREVSARAVAHTRGFVLRAAPVVESLGQLADKGLAVDDPDRLAPQLLAVLQANPGLSWVSYSDERGTFTGAYHAPEGGLQITYRRIVNGKTTRAVYEARRGSLVYEVFDLLHLDGHDLRNRPLIRRRELLALLVADLPIIRCSKSIPEHGRAFFDAVSAHRLEGIVAKQAGSKYREGVRSKSWLKIKTRQSQKAVIGGFTQPKGSRTGLGALVLGIYETGKLVHIGDDGSGITEKELGTLRGRLDELQQKTCPFQKCPRPRGTVHWVQPVLVCEVSFAEWTHDGHLRHPVFLGLREDEDASTVQREMPQRVAAMVTTGTAGIESARSPAAKAMVAKPRPNRQETIGGRVVSLTNQRKVYWPNDGYTKGDLIDYYRQVAGFILPYLNDRPLSLNRHPNGIQGASFFQRDVSNQPPPSWVQTARFTSDGKRVCSVLCQDEATLVYLANLGCIELNPWNSRVGTLDSPDYVVLDLDPEDVSFDSVIETALAIRKVLDRIGAESRCKTSGKRGLHIYIPFAARHGHDQAKHLPN
jgi:bifunctional non-homologous end joining protein LigD